ncbi:unnamed protein product [Didymodactylos carnosus]|uniref:Uncharacterized protein n=1 Tax=Didymodactylos carnosus TaxID=1234261 RepID=A0A814SQ81_9BILA|nr:unnamed protein product [Didymodactylos carnosus]CAF3914848.1 unnamed protein product [Didymodactylos carnosus]
MLFTWISGITVSTIPAILINIVLAKKEIREKNSLDEHDDFFIKKLVSDKHHSNVENKIHSLPNVEEIRVKAYILIIVLILSICFSVYLVTFIAIGLRLQFHYEPSSLKEDDIVINPWSDGLARFVKDVYINIFVMFVVISRTSLFPAIIHRVISILKQVVPWRFKIIFDYILLNNHRLTTVLYPAVQTRLYLTITLIMQITGVFISLILDFTDEPLSVYNGGTRFMIFMFETVNARFAGYQTIDISRLAAGTLLTYMLLMAAKPQMLCAINENPFELEWIVLQTQEKVEQKLETRRQSMGLQNTTVLDVRRQSVAFPINRVQNFLKRQSTAAKTSARKHFSKHLKQALAKNQIGVDDIHNVMNIDRGGQQPQISHRPSAVASGSSNDDDTNISWLRRKLFIIVFTRQLIQSISVLIISPRMWLFLFLFLICSFEQYHLHPTDTNITVFKIIFEIISGYPGIASSFCSVFSSKSKVIIIICMCIERHRGLVDSMKDQEQIEYSAVGLN